MPDPIPFKTSMDFAYGAPKVLAPDIVRVVANNPGPFTFKGTNTYVVGTSTLAIIDPGPEDEAHLATVEIHRASVMEKTGSASLADVVRLYLRVEAVQAQRRG